jgi:glycerol uptake facilitator-like aquaporin
LNWEIAGALRLKINCILKRPSQLNLFKGELSPWRAFLAEVIFSMAMLQVAYGVAFDARQRKIFGPIMAPFIIGATVALLIWASAELVEGYTG